MIMTVKTAYETENEYIKLVKKDEPSHIVFMVQLRGDKCAHVLRENNTKHEYKQPKEKALY